MWLQQIVHYLDKKNCRSSLILHTELPQKAQKINSVLYSPRNDLDPKMIPNPKMIPKLTLKWSRPRNDPHIFSRWPQNDPQVVFGMAFKHGNVDSSIIIIIVFPTGRGVRFTWGLGSSLLTPYRQPDSCSEAHTLYLIMASVSLIIEESTFPCLNAIPKIVWGSFRGQFGDHFRACTVLHECLFK